MAVTHPVAVKLDTEVRDRIRRLAEAQNRSAHYLMREAIGQYVEREEKREALRQDALRAWATFQETGIHVEADAADVWLDQLEAGQDIDPPAGTV